MTRGSTRDDQQMLTVVRITEKTYTAATDCNSLAECGEAERLKLHAGPLRKDDVRRVSSRYQRRKRGHAKWRTCRRDRSSCVSDGENVGMRDRS